ncbi:MAG: hypothetical protein M1833_004368 [Piccolia ochrophora]|nr:MAG: hypothetical protein M1833_004368 [Piccolia ochrophora]
MTPKIRVMVRSMERTTRSLLANLNKQNPNGPLAPRIQQHLERLNRIRLDVFDEGTRKRAAPVEPTDGLDPTKRARLGADVPNIPSSRIRIPPLAPGPTSLAQLYTLTSDQALTSFDVQQLPIDMVIQITLPVLFRLEQSVLDDCINGVRARYRSLGALQQVNAPSIPTAAPPMEDEDDDYEPDFEPAEDDEQILNKLDTAPPGSEVVPALGPFRLPPPPRLTETEATDIGQGVISRVFGFMNALDEPPRSKQPKTGINRLAASTYDKHAWVTVVTRLATRASSGLGSSANVKSEDADSALDGGHPSTTLSESIREALYMHIIADFRPRIDIAVAWLTEEWYNDRIIASASEASSQGTLQYDRSVLRVLDGILPYLDARDKVFTRFLSEIPVISPAVLERVKRLARDPERVMLAVSSLHYLVLLRPPAREMSLDALEDLWQNYDDARLAAAKVLSKWRPLAVQPEPIAKPPTVISPQDGSGVTPKEEMQVAREGVTASS